MTVEQLIEKLLEANVGSYDLVLDGAFMVSGIEVDDKNGIVNII